MNTPQFFSTVAAAVALTLMLPGAGRAELPEPEGLTSPIAPSSLSRLSSYVPPQRGIPRTTQGTGSRGCPQAAPVALTLLVPNDHTAQTVSDRPSFFWQVSEVPAQSVEFALIESGVAQPIFVQQVQVEHAGIVRLALPPSAPALVPGKEYRWSVSLVCNPNRRSNDVFAQAWIRRVAASAELSQQLASVAPTPDAARDRASIYASNGLWYDALESLLSQTQAPISSAAVSLLGQGGLTQVATQEQQRSLQTLKVSP